MKPPRLPGPSIRRTLLTGYALIMILTLSLFGGLLYYRLHRTVHRGIHRELETLANALSGALEAEERNRYELELSDEFLARFRRKDDDAPWFVISDPKGIPVLSEGKPPKKSGKRKEAAVRVGGPEGTQIAVGRRIEDDLEKLDRFLAVVVLGGLGILALSLGGGWWLVGRTLRPIRKISDTATTISETRLSERIDVGQTESELGRLAATLNETFDRLQEAIERQARFTADASHELRTPLSVVTTNAELALSRERDPEEYRETLRTCLRSARRMRDVVEGLLVLARSDSGKTGIRREKVDLAETLIEIRDFLRPMAEEAGTELQLTTQPVPVTGDPERLREAIGNLVSNAIRYNREGGRVEIELAPEEDRAVLKVKDTGIGIPESAIPHLFERFYRVDKARSREIGGSGLGLAIAKWIVDAHQGTITVESREGEGSTFTLILPLEEQESRPAE